MELNAANGAAAANASEMGGIGAGIGAIGTVAGAVII